MAASPAHSSSASASKSSQLQKAQSPNKNQQNSDNDNDTNTTTKTKAKTNTNTDQDEMGDLFAMMGKLNLTAYAQIANTYSDSDSDTVREALTKQLRNDLTRLGYSSQLQQQKHTDIEAIVNLISSYVCM